MRRMRHIDEDGIDEDMFADLFFETFETRLSDGSTVELLEDGAATDVTFSTRDRFADLTIAARLAEGGTQCEALLAGIVSIVPSTRLLSLLTGLELEKLICGEADVDVAALRHHTSYGATAAGGMAHVRYFWAVLESFTPEQRRLFLKFIWGRNRLPLTGAPIISLLLLPRSRRISPYLPITEPAPSTPSLRRGGLGGPAHADPHPREA